MKLNRSTFLLGVFAMSLSSCALFDSGGETIKGHYNTVWIDVKSNRSICHSMEDGDLGGSEKISAFIKRIGFNDRFIIAERMYFEFKMNKPDYNRVTYYIIDTEVKSPYDNKDVLGPFNQTDFKKKKRELGIEDLQFTEEYHDY